MLPRPLLLASRHIMGVFDLCQFIFRSPPAGEHSIMFSSAFSCFLFSHRASVDHDTIFYSFLLRSFLLVPIGASLLLVA
jgi:hypothetical protein